MEEIYEQIEFGQSASTENNKEGAAVQTEDAVNENKELTEAVVEVAELPEEGSEKAETEIKETEAQVENTEQKLENSVSDAEKTDENGEKEKKPSRRRASKSDGEHSDGSETPIAPEKMPKAEAMRVLEAIMFANGDEVYYDQFAKIIGYTTKEAIKVVDAYAKMYDSGSLPRGIRFVKYEKCCQLTTAPDLGEYVTQMIGIRGEPQLSAAAMETLAIVAYNQPVTRAYIEQVRRVDSTRPIAVLLDRELIEEKGRLDVIGRPRLFGTTQSFLRTFGITSLDALPSLDLFTVES